MARLSLLFLSSLLAVVQARQLHPSQRKALKSQLLQSAEASYTFCDEPVQKGKVTFPDSIAGRANTNFDMYSGYVNVTDAPDYLFYWFFGTQDGKADAPLVIWTNGGPGCTAMEGATTEHGPLVLFDVKESCQGPQCDYSGQLSSNAYAWNRHANVLYLDQPRNVGYSFGYGSGAKSSTEAAADFVTFYGEWLQLFPEFIGRELVIAGESYGGHYIPAWAAAVLDYNEGHVEAPIPLSGVIIGNGCVNDTVQGTDSFVQFQHEQNLIPADSNPRNMAAAEAAMVSHLGYTPNYYDYRLGAVQCDACYSYNYTAWSAWFLQPEVLDALHVCGQAGDDAFAGSAGGCISMGAFDAHDDFDYSGALGRTLDAGIPVSVYYGKTDTACQYVGGAAMTETISWGGQEAYATTPLQPLEIAGVEAGQVRSSGGLTMFQIEDAGHMVPMDQPAGTSAVLQHMLTALAPDASAEEL